MTASSADETVSTYLAQTLSRAPSANYLPALTGLRGIAACWVLLFHLWQFSGSPKLMLPLGFFDLDLTPLAAFGYMGVDLFFVLSGFLLSIPFLRADRDGTKRPNLVRYAIRRCRRVLPAYYVQLAIICAVSYFTGEMRALTPSNLIAHTLLVQNLFPSSVPLNGVYWTMPIEWDFYIVLPLMAFVLAKVRPAITLAILVTLSVAFRFACYRAVSDPAWAEFVDFGRIMQLPARLDEFFYGVLGAWLFLRYPFRTVTTRWMIVVGVAGVLSAIVVNANVANFIYPAKLPWILIGFTWLGLAFGAIVLGSAAQHGLQTWFSSRVVAWLGLISYSLYLWHYPLLDVALRFGWAASGGAPALLQNFVLLTPPILLVSWLSQHFVERPFLVSRHHRHGMPASLEK